MPGNGALRFSACSDTVRFPGIQTATYRMASSRPGLEDSVTGLSIVLRNILQELFTADTRSLQAGDLASIGQRRTGLVPRSRSGCSARPRRDSPVPWLVNRRSTLTPVKFASRLTDSLNRSGCKECIAPVLERRKDHVTECADRESIRLSGIA